MLFLGSYRNKNVKNASMIFLQETYSSNDQERVWSNEWGCKIYFCHGSIKHSKGTAILFNPKLQVTIERHIQGEDGRILTYCVRGTRTQPLICAVREVFSRLHFRRRRHTFASL